MTKPFLKWVGGKTQIIDQVLELFPKTMNNYYEPFVGGGSVLLGFLTHVKEGHIKLTGKVYASDLNLNLITAYQAVQSHPETLIEEVGKLMEEFKRSSTGDIVNRKASNLTEALTSAESYYYWIRSRFNALSSEDKKNPVAAAMFLFMNKTCFRGVYREGPKGVNVPFGHYKTQSILEEAHIREVSALIRDVVFTHRSFDESFESVKSGDFVYVDPPYAPESIASFVGYTRDGFPLDAHTRLFALCKNTDATFLMSNAHVSLVINAFPPPIFTTKIISCRRAINSKNPGARTNEVLITNQRET
jgi:DNA adenine methylase